MYVLHEYYSNRIIDDKKFETRKEASDYKNQFLKRLLKEENTTMLILIEKF